MVCYMKKNLIGIDWSRLLVQVCITMIVFCLYACFQEETVPVTIDFTYTIGNESYTTPARITIANNTTGAEKYSWTFEGGQPATSSLRDPGIITFTEAGAHTITLEAWSEDDRQSKTISLTVYNGVTPDFSVEILTNNIAPVTVRITNKTIGGTGFRWVFEQGNPAEYTGENPPDIQFVEPGDHKIILIVENGPAVDSLVQTISVSPALSPDFEIIPDFEDDDYEAPLRAVLANNTVGGLQWQWSSSGGQISNTTVQQPSIYFSKAGTYSITLQASNGKETMTITKDIVVKPNTGLRTFTDIKLGINTAHASIGSFYSTSLRRVVTKNDPDSLLKYVDIAYFGLNATFTFNKFTSPDSVEEYTFDPIPQGQITHFINSLDKCACGISFSESDFDQMTTDAPLQALNITSTAKGLQPFDDVQVPRIVLFKTQDNRKGVIKIKSFHYDGLQSYILVDIKVQKK
ncbi:PKD repeat-containing protein [Ohtaekwangia koreensis]|uniref:PKD repeat-containing protein n=2 Tax=Ohtaekwangia koreensis TaxID=688867 RepID=A0A1T5M196_9BACT|nr:PKD repeat-containing protein [Ohtaekwangia koreensis]